MPQPLIGDHLLGRQNHLPDSR